MDDRVKMEAQSSQVDTEERRLPSLGGDAVRASQLPVQVVKKEEPDAQEFPENVASGHARSGTSTAATPQSQNFAHSVTNRAFPAWHKFHGEEAAERMTAVLRELGKPSPFLDIENVYRKMYGVDLNDRERQRLLRVGSVQKFCEEVAKSGQVVHYHTGGGQLKNFLGLAEQCSGSSGFNQQLMSSNRIATSATNWDSRGPQTHSQSSHVPPSLSYDPLQPGQNGRPDSGIQIVQCMISILEELGRPSNYIEIAEKYKERYGAKLNDQERRRLQAGSILQFCQGVAKSGLIIHYKTGDGAAENFLGLPHQEFNRGTPAPRQKEIEMKGWPHDRTDGGKKAVECIISILEELGKPSSFHAIDEKYLERFGVHLGTPERYKMIGVGPIRLFCQELAKSGLLVHHKTGGGPRNNFLGLAMPSNSAAKCPSDGNAVNRDGGGSSEANEAAAPAPSRVVIQNKEDIKRELEELRSALGKATEGGEKPVEKKRKAPTVMEIGEEPLEDGELENSEPVAKKRRHEGTEAEAAVEKAKMFGNLISNLLQSAARQGLDVDSLASELFEVIQEKVDA